MAAAGVFGAIFIITARDEEKMFGANTNTSAANCLSHVKGREGHRLLIGHRKKTLPVKA